MELTYNELRKRDVINIVDGKCLGRIVDMKLKFPEGVLQGIFVPGRKKGFLSCLCDRSTIYVDESRIIKIGGDVILVNLSSEKCVEKPKPKPCIPPCAPCQPPKQPKGNCVDFSILSGGSSHIDEEEY